MSTTISPYVNFDGNCEGAVQFWADAIGAQTQIMKMGESPMPVPESAKNRVMHAAIRKDGFLLLASDCMPGQPLVRGNSVSLCLIFTDREEQDRVWSKLSVGGQVTMPLSDQFFGRFGMLTDKFGIQWMLSLEKA